MVQKFFTLLLCLAGACLTKIILDYFEIFKNFRISWLTVIACSLVVYLFSNKSNK